ncbi:putative gustatory receptor clone PTE03 [Cynoglossus semilaevis]|uniref:putative gustatory receptor clone PTE03 n=1 Tax=Cynoglossus semilaevis TaxID=244447 RepID=UPI000496E7A9|nr:putative gustatory receptor clone PTE03 [Cynoglossus semilaevis]
MNSTLLLLSNLIFGAYLNGGDLRYLYFTVTALLYMVIVVSNTCVIVVICMNRSLHEPMYIFMCNLFINELYGATGLFPLLLVQLLSDIHTVPASLCFLQIYCLYTYAHVEFCTLAVMAYDRYLAICCPLLYNRRMTPHRALILNILVWFYSFVKVLVTLSLNLHLKLCGNTIDSVYCHNYLIVKLSCSDTTINNIYGVFGVILTIMVPLLPILFSYLKIFQVCFSGCVQTRVKALSTCSPQLASLINFSFGCTFEILRSRFDMIAVPSVLRIVLSLYFLLIQPLLSPIMFGLQMTKIRNVIKRVLGCKTLCGPGGK